jgi:hypothetical protein
VAEDHRAELARLVTESRRTRYWLIGCTVLLTALAAIEAWHLLH